MICPTCHRTLDVGNVQTVRDTPTGLHVVTDELGPVRRYVCSCGWTFTLASSTGCGEAVDSGTGSAGSVA